MTTVKIALCTQFPKVWLLSSLIKSSLVFQILQAYNTTVKEPAPIKYILGGKSGIIEAMRCLSISSSNQSRKPTLVLSQDNRVLTYELCV